ncbi:MAG: aspartate carbamoyltransferase catalytic subunit [Vampirovibrionales bacterium]
MMRLALPDPARPLPFVDLISPEAFGTWTQTHLIDSTALQHGEVLQLLAQAAEYERLFQPQALKKLDSYKGRVVATLFYENSTRTRASFELAAKYLGATTLDLPVQVSSVNKGETLHDTLDTLKAMGVEMVVLRHSASGIHQQLAQYVGDSMSLVNAGDGQHDHPTQGLLDVFTLLQALGSLFDKTITIVGDSRHSRVARANMALLPMFGAKVRLVAPETLLPLHAQESFKLDKVTTNLAEGLEGADAVMCLRLQKERMEASVSGSLGGYVSQYRVDEARLKAHCQPHVKVLHPGPVNRDVELTSALMDHPDYSLLQQQVHNGVLIRMAVLSKLFKQRYTLSSSF